MSTRKSRKKKVVVVSDEPGDIDVIYPDIPSKSEVLKEFPTGLSGRRYLDDTILTILFEEEVK